MNDSGNNNGIGIGIGIGNRAGYGKNIVIVGSGFVGTTLARSFERRLPAGHPIVPARYALPTAQFAVAQADTQAPTLAHNLAARIAQRPTRAFAHVSKGMMATTGHLKGVAQVGRLRLSGLPAWLLWRGYDLLLMPTFGRKVRIWVEWTWGMFFAADITHLRFTRTSEVDADAVLPPTYPARPMHPVLVSTSSAASVSPPLSQVQLQRQPQT